MKCERRFMHGKRRRRSPIKLDTMDVVGTVLPATAAASVGVVQGYGELAKSKHGSQIIQDSGVGRLPKW